MAGGFRSLIGKWIGGLSLPRPKPGFRGMLGFWLGGINAPSEPIPPKRGLYVTQEYLRKLEELKKSFFQEVKRERRSPRIRYIEKNVPAPVPKRVKAHKTIAKPAPNYYDDEIATILLEII